MERRSSRERPARRDNLRVDEEGTCRYGEEFHLCVIWDHVGSASVHG